MTGFLIEIGIAVIAIEVFRRVYQWVSGKDLERQEEFEASIIRVMEENYDRLVDDVTRMMWDIWNKENRIDIWKDENERIHIVAGDAHDIAFKDVFGIIWETLDGGDLVHAIIPDWSTLDNYLDEMDTLSIPGPHHKRLGDTEVPLLEFDDERE